MRKTDALRLTYCFLCPVLGHAEGLLAVANPAKNGIGDKVYATTEAFEGNDQVAMRQYGGDWQGSYSPRSGTNIGLLSARAEAGLQWQGYRLGILHRAEAVVEANRDTADFVQQYSTRSGYDLGRTYQLDYQISGFEADGARLSRSFQLDLGSQWQMDWGLGLSYLRGNRIRLETVTGQAVAINSKDLNTGARMTSTDSQINVAKLAKFNAPFGLLLSPSGQGYALDAGLVLHHQKSGASLEMAVADLVGRMHWKDLPTNVSTYSSATKYYDADGYVQFNPSATRTSSYQNLSQVLDPKLWLAVNYPIGEFEVQGATSYTRGYWFPQAGAKYRINPQWGLGAVFDFRFRTFQLSLNHQFIYLALRADSINLGQARAYGISGGFNVPF